MLDRELRATLQGLAADDAPMLDAAARDRLARQLVDAAPGILRRARAARRLERAGGVALAAAAAAALVVGIGSSGDVDLPAAAPGPRACESRAVPAGAARGFVDQGGRRLLDLGAHARAVAMPGADVSVERAAACETRIAQRSGRLIVAATDLGGGELGVTTPHGEVRAPAGLFAVYVVGDELAVEVADATATFVRAGEEPRSIAAGTRLVWRARAVATSPLDPQAARDLRRQLR